MCELNVVWSLLSGWVFCMMAMVVLILINIFGWCCWDISSRSNPGHDLTRLITCWVHRDTHLCANVGIFKPAINTVSYNIIMFLCVVHIAAGWVMSKCSIHANMYGRNILSILEKEKRTPECVLTGPNWIRPNLTTAARVGRTGGPCAKHYFFWAKTRDSCWRRELGFVLTWTAVHMPSYITIICFC
jgi:hypothetical protein